MDLVQIIATGVILLLAAVLQSAVGFGFGLFSIPLMLFVGLPLPVAVMIVCFLSALQAAFGLRHYWAQVKWHEVMVHTGARVLTIPMGVVVLGIVVTLGQARIQQIVGLMVLLALLTLLGLRVKPQPKVHQGWNCLAGALNGFLDGLIGMGGPPTVIWLAAHRWTSKQMRAFFWAVMVVGFPFMLVPLWLKFGNEVTLWGLAIGMGASPLVWLGVRGGIYLGKHLPRRRLRVVALAMLFLIALSSLLRPLISGDAAAPSANALQGDIQTQDVLHFGHAHDMQHQ